VPAFIQLIVSNPGAVAQTGGALQSAAQGFTATGQAFRQGMTTALANWQGNTRNRADAVTDRFVTGTSRMAGTVRQAAAAVEEGGTALQELVLQLRAGISSAQGAGFLVIPVGQVFPGPPHYAQAAAAGPGAPAVLQMFFAIARMWTMYFQTIVNVATVQDEVTARAIGGIVMHLDALLPFRSSVRAPQWFGGSNQRENNRLRGELGEELNLIHDRLRRRQQLGTQVRIRRAPGDPLHTRADRTFENLDDGALEAVEVKAGASRPQPRQVEILPGVRYGGQQMGDDGMAPHLRHGDVIQPGQVTARTQRWDVDALPESTRNAIYYQRHSLQDILNGRAGPEARDELTRWIRDPRNRRERTL
jgi:uncharacterized protein YukE